jgi:hypothetical protein
MSSSFLKDWLHRTSLSQTDKLLVVLSTFEGPASITQILEKAETAGVRRKQWANPSATLSRTKGLAIHTGQGWEITNAGRQKLANDGLVESGAGILNVATDLRKYLANVSVEEVSSFLNEAIRAYELGLYRSAVVMSWLAAVYVLQQTVVSGHLDEFNNEAKRVGQNWKAAKSTDDLAKMKESEFLDRLVAIGLIGANVKTSLKECLDRRNACGHPNSFKIGQNMTAAHVETLLLNVFKRFS